MNRLPCPIPLVKTLLLAAFVATGLGCASSPPTLPEGQEVTINKSTFSFDKESLLGAEVPSYRIASGDQLDVLFQVRTWMQREQFSIAADHTIEIKFVYAPELNQTQRVRPDGNLSLPYIGDVFVIGKTVEQLTEELKEKYKSVLRSPQLYVVIPDFRSAIKELKADLHTAPRGLSRLVTVRPDGVATFPMIGDLRVAGRTVPEVNEELNRKYEAYLPGLHCNLFLEKTSGSVVYVQGEVRKPGSFEISKPISVLEALTLAGSPTTGARLDNVIVVRRHADKLVATRVDVARSLDLSGSGSFFYLQPDDIVLVPRTAIAQVAEVMRAVSDIILFRGWSFSFDYNLHNAR